MAMRAKGKVESVTEVKETEKLSENAVVQELATKVPMTTVSFRTKLATKRKVEGIFDEMGITMSAAINMFLTQVAREKGMPFTPNVQGKSEKDVALSSVHDKGKEFDVLEELWDSI